MDDPKRWSQKVAARLNQHTEQITRLSKQLHSIEGRTMAPGQDDGRWIDEMVQRQHHYANTVLLLGYGGFFALWSSTHGVMPRWLFATSGTLIAVSIALFVGWEMVRMRTLSKAVRDAVLPDQDGNVMSPREARNHVVDAARRIDGRYHLPIFWASTVSGFVAGFAVLAFFIWHLSSTPISDSSNAAVPKAETGSLQATPAVDSTVSRTPPGSEQRSRTSP